MRVAIGYPPSGVNFLNPFAPGGIFIRHLLLAAALLLLAACGGDSGFVKTGSGESGVGGTGISLVKGNVTDIDGAGPGSMAFDDTSVSAGGRQSKLSPDGGFTLLDVPPADNLVLVFTDSEGKRVTLSLGPFPAGGTATVDDVDLDYSTGNATARNVEIEAPPGGSQGPGNPNGIGNGCEPKENGNGCSKGHGNAGGNGGSNGNNGNGNSGNANSGNNGNGNGNNGNGNNGNGNSG
jgi:hypothetical protein